MSSLRLLSLALLGAVFARRSLSRRSNLLSACFCEVSFSSIATGINKRQDVKWRVLYVILRWCIQGAFIHSGYLRSWSRKVHFRTRTLYFLLELRSLLSLLLLLLFIFLYQYPCITPVHNVNTLPPLATSKEVRGCVVHAIKSRWCIQGHSFIQDVCALWVEKYILEPVLFISTWVKELNHYFYFYYFYSRSIRTLLKYTIGILCPPMATSREVKWRVAIKFRWCVQGHSFIQDICALRGTDGGSHADI